jgi:hypothetical protein
VDDELPKRVCKECGAPLVYTPELEWAERNDNLSTLLGGASILKNTNKFGESGVPPNKSGEANGQDRLILQGDLW